MVLVWCFAVLGVQWGCRRWSHPGRTPVGHCDLLIASATARRGYPSAGLESLTHSARLRRGSWDDR